MADEDSISALLRVQLSVAQISSCIINCFEFFERHQHGGLSQLHTYRVLHRGAAVPFRPAIPRVVSALLGMTCLKQEATPSLRATMSYHERPHST